MSEADKIALTVLSGVLVYIIGQILLKLFLEPVVKLKECIGSVNFTIVRFAHIIHHHKAAQHQQFEEAFNALRSQSGDLYSKYSAIPWYPVTRIVFGLPRKDRLFDAARNLLALTNWMSQEDNAKVGWVLKNVQDLYENLNLEIPPESKIDRDTINKLIQAYMERAA